MSKRTILLACQWLGAAVHFAGVYAVYLGVVTAVEAIAILTLVIIGMVFIHMEIRNG